MGKKLELLVVPFRLQEARLELLKQMLKEREENHNNLTSKRLDKLWAQKQDKRETKVKHIRNEYLKSKVFIHTLLHRETGSLNHNLFFFLWVTRIERSKKNLLQNEAALLG